MEASEPQRVLVRLRPGFEALGMVLDLLSRTPPFAQYDLDQISAAIAGDQLTHGPVLEFLGRF